MTIKKHILQYLQCEKRYVKRRDLLFHLRSLGFDITDRAMRKEIEDSIRQGALIESSEKGYRIISDEESLNRAVDYLRSKAEAIEWRRCQIIHNWREKKLKEANGQFVMFG